ncbi:MAG: hypothetical protein K6L75_07265 [Cellvibrionaceae bacterium]
MTRTKINSLSQSIQEKPDLWVFFIALFLLILHVSQQPSRVKQLLPLEVKQFTLSMFYDVNDQDISITTYVPQNNNRQNIIEQTIQSGLLDYRLDDIPSGRLAVWEGSELTGSHKVVYRAKIAQQATRFNISPDLTVPTKYSEAFQEYLAPTEAVQVNHPEVSNLWDTIKPSASQEMLPLLTAIFYYTYNELSSVPFKGMTDALTALRLKQASCNGKSRLFVALARLNKIPARLVGGVILEGGPKKTSHQWVEVYVGEHWVPFDPTNGHFAFLPARYLELYRGDEVLFKHTRNISFDYEFEIRSNKIAAGVQSGLAVPERADRLNVIALLALLGLEENTASIFLLFPLCALCITFFRNIVGLGSFGIFMPMLVAAACRYTGLQLGVIVFTAVLAIAFLMHRGLDHVKLLKVPRLAAVITGVTLVFLFVISFLDLRQSSYGLGVVALFPVVIISFTAERLHHLVEDASWKEILSNALGSLLIIIICYFVFGSLLLRGLFAIYPECFLFVLAGQIFIGRWTGVRVSEYFRFSRLIRGSKGDLLSINARNRNVVLDKNPKHLIQLANDKLRAKEVLLEAGVPVPETIHEYSGQLECQNLEKELEDLHSFVIKPNRGSQGRGILVIREKVSNGWKQAGGSIISLEGIRRHIQEIIAGSFSSDGKADTAFIEPFLVQHDLLNTISPYGLSDIRVIVHDGKAIASMWRVPTSESNGKANLHQGAIGVAIDIESGVTNRAQLHGKEIETHPDTKQQLCGIEIPFWQDIVTISEKCYDAVPLGYLGVDVCIDTNIGPLILEINARPGLEIQNVRDKGIGDLIGKFESGVVPV